MTVNGLTYRVIRLLGHGKGGYSWLAEADGREVVLKQIHHEPCDYYTFGNKIEAECRDYERLKNAGIMDPDEWSISTRLAPALTDPVAASNNGKASVVLDEGVLTITADVNELEESESSPLTTP